MTWVLLWVVISGRGVTNDSVEFETHEACQQAASAVAQMDNQDDFWWARVKGICVEKGVAK